MSRLINLKILGKIGFKYLFYLIISILITLFFLLSLINLKLNTKNINLTPSETLQLIINNEIRKDQKIIRLSEIIFPNDSEIKKDDSNKYSNILFILTSTSTKDIEASLLVSVCEEDKTMYLYSIPSNMYFIDKIDITNENEILNAYSKYLNLQIQYLSIIEENKLLEMVPSSFEYEYFSEIETIVGTSSTPIVKGINILKREDTFWVYMNSTRKSSLLAEIFIQLINKSNTTKIFNDFFYNSKHSELTITEDEIMTNLLNVSKNNFYSFIFQEEESNIFFKLVSIEEKLFIYPLIDEKVFKEISNFIYYSRKEPDIYKQDVNIYIYNSGLGYDKSFDWTQSIRKGYPFINIIFMGDKTIDNNDSIIKATGDLPHEFVEGVSKNIKISNVEYLTNSENSNSIYIYLVK